MPDGLYRDEDGNKLFNDNLEKVGGVNQYNQVEPPAKAVVADTDTKNMGEEESEAGEINQAKADSEEFQKKENARKAAEAAEKAAAEAEQAH